MFAPQVFESALEQHAASYYRTALASTGACAVHRGGNPGILIYEQAALLYFITITIILDHLSCFAYGGTTHSSPIVMLKKVSARSKLVRRCRCCLLACGGLQSACCHRGHRKKHTYKKRFGCGSTGHLAAALCGHVAFPIPPRLLYFTLSTACETCFR